MMGIIWQSPCLFAVQPTFNLMAIPPLRTELDETTSIEAKLLELQIEHRDLDIAIAQIQTTPFADQLHIKRLKKRKLQLKDAIARLKDRLIPDLDA